MYDLKKTLNHLRGVRKREAAGLPPYTMTDEERAASDKLHARIREKLAAIPWNGPEHLRPASSPRPTDPKKPPE